LGLWGGEQQKEKRERCKEGMKAVDEEKQQLFVADERPNKHARM
jgi:hypothetical protein